MDAICITSFFKAIKSGRNLMLFYGVLMDWNRQALFILLVKEFEALFKFSIMLCEQ